MIKNLTEAEEKEFYRLVGKMNGEETDKEQGVKVRKPRKSEEYFYISNDGAVIQSRYPVKMRRQTMHSEPVLLQH